MAVDPRIVEFQVKEDKKDGEDQPKDWGLFKAQVRDFNTALRIEVLADEEMVKRGINYDKVSQTTRFFFSVLATFSISCVQTPEEFNISAVMAGSPTECTQFLAAYATALDEAERRFREGAPKAGKK